MCGVFVKLIDSFGRGSWYQGKSIWSRQPSDIFNYMHCDLLVRAGQGVTMVPNVAMGENLAQVEGQQYEKRCGDKPVIIAEESLYSHCYKDAVDSVSLCAIQILM